MPYDDESITRGLHQTGEIGPSRSLPHAVLLIHEDGGPRAIALEPNAPLVIGRRRPADIVIDRSSVSRRHARVFFDGDALEVDDIGSRNGIKVGGRKVLNVRLRPGEQMHIGGVGMALHVGTPRHLTPAPVLVDGAADAAQRSPRSSRVTGTSARVAPSRLLVGSASMREVMQTLERVAPARLPVLVVGETGTGKELVARELHARSPRRNGPFRAVNCGAVPDTLAESLFFGHQRGAFTGAERASKGIFGEADGGTVFLDEVGELSARAQAALLRVLELGQVMPVGSARERDVDVRLVAATNRDLESMCDRGLFRRDLLYRLNVALLELPPLRERAEEIRPLALHFIREANANNERHVEGIAEDVWRALHAYDWPGNVRELRNVLERAVVVAHRGEMQVAHLPQHVAACAGRGASASDDRRPTGDDHAAVGTFGQVHETVDELSYGTPLQPQETRPEMPSFKLRIERVALGLIDEALVEHGGSKAAAARALDIPLRTLKAKVRAPAELDAALCREAAAKLRAFEGRQPPPTRLDFWSRIRRYELALIDEALEAVAHNKAEASRLLAIPLRTMHDKLAARDDDASES